MTVCDRCGSCNNVRAVVAQMIDTDIYVCHARETRDLCAMCRTHLIEAIKAAMAPLAKEGKRETVR